MSKVKCKRPNWACTLVGLGLLLLSSCLKERAVPIASAFSIVASEDKTSPLEVQLHNESYGADEYEWLFEGGEPSTSHEKQPGRVIFRQAGVHKISLRVWNSVEERTSTQEVQVDSALSLQFDFSVALNDIAPGLLTIENKSKGGRKYEWLFEGGLPERSSEQHPAPVLFEEGGEHWVRLKVFNGSRYEEMSKSFVLQPRMQADFSYEPLAVDRDWEAPLSLQLHNLTSGGLSYEWQCSGARVFTPRAENTMIRFEQPGSYLIKLVADNGKERKEVEKSVTIKENSRLLEVNDLRFGINDAKNTIGCFFSSREGRVLTSRQIAEQQLGDAVDFGFFAINSTFSYCYFFSPTEALRNAFPQIVGARRASFVNNIAFDDAQFEAISKAQDLSSFSLWEEASPQFFSNLHTPHYSLVRTEDGRRGIIRIKEFFRAGKDSYIVADVKLEKRPHE